MKVIYAIFLPEASNACLTNSTAAAPLADFASCKNKNSYLSLHLIF